MRVLAWCTTIVMTFRCIKPSRVLTVSESIARIVLPAGPRSARLGYNSMPATGRFPTGSVREAPRWKAAGARLPGLRGNRGIR